jgi:hypothetical protein
VDWIHLAQGVLVAGSCKKYCNEPSDGMKLVSTYWFHNTQTGCEMSSFNCIVTPTACIRVL